MKKFLIALLIFLMLLMTGCFFDADDVIFEDAEFVYDGQEKTIISTSKIPKNISLVYENNVATDAGVYETKMSVYNIKKGELLLEKTATLTIKKATYDMSAVKFENEEFIYNGKPHSLLLSSTLPEGVSVSYSENGYINAGTYSVTAYFTGDEKNYEKIPSQTAKMIIHQAEPNPTLTLKNTSLNTSSKPIATADMEGEAVFADGQTLVVGTNTYYFDFYPKSTNYKAKLNIPLSLTVKASVHYVTENGTTDKYVDYGNHAQNLIASDYEKSNVLYYFSHWSKQAGGSAFDFNTPIYSDISLYGVFKTEEKKYLNLHYSESNTESFGYYSQKFPVALPKPANSGFLGWYLRPFFTSEKVSSLNDTSIKDLYALYTPEVTLSKNESIGLSEISSTVSKEMKKEQIYEGTLIEVNEILSSKVSSSSLVSLYENTNHVSLSSTSLVAKNEAVSALEKLCLDFSKKGSAYSILVSSAFTESDSYPDLESGYSFLLKAISDSDKVYSLDDGAVQIVNNFLESNAAAYGFIRRYTKENESSTGLPGASVYRYVGVPHASFMTEHSLSLEEYIAYLKGLNGKHLFIKDNTTEYEIYYTPYASSLSLSKNESVNISGDNKNGFIITVTRDISPRDLGKLICLDAGHGGKDPGAVSADAKEADITLSVIKLLEAECVKQGFSVLLTRSADVFVDLDDRCYIANKAKSDIFVSVHCNSATSVSANGTEVFYYSGANSINLANKVYKAMINEVPLTERGVKQANHAVTRGTNMPAILCELAFISNYSDRTKLTDPEYQAKWAKAICKGICAYYGVPYLELD